MSFFWFTMTRAVRVKQDSRGHKNRNNVLKDNKMTEDSGHC